jgi:hypothetical protein
MVIPMVDRRRGKYQICSIPLSPSLFYTYSIRVALPSLIQHSILITCIPSPLFHCIPSLLQACLSSVMSEYTKCLADSLKLFYGRLEEHSKLIQVHEDQANKSKSNKKNVKTYLEVFQSDNTIVSITHGELSSSK